jgi:CRISPR-associated endoribonuclease Cas6
MRIKILFKATDKTLPINNQHILNSFIHKILGKNNEYHNKKSNYSISHLCGGKMNSDKQTLSFINGTYIIITSLDMNFINKILTGLVNSVDEFFMYNGVEIIEEKFYNGWNHFFTLSPILIKEYKNKNEYIFLTSNNCELSAVIESHTKRKFQRINENIDFDGFEVVIDNDKNKVKKILVKNVINHATMCKISIKCNKHLAELIYNYGIGQSCGGGFGTIYKTENRDKYKY